MMGALNDIDRRLANIVRVGTIAELDEAQALVKIDLGDQVTDWLPWATGRSGGNRSWDAHEVGEQVMLFAPSGELAAAVVMGSIPQTAHPAPASSKDHTRYQWSDGAYIDYDRAGHLYRLDVPAGGGITLHIGQTTLILQDGKATLTTPELLVQSPKSTFSGQVIVNGLLTYAAGLAGNGGVAGSSITGPLNVTGQTALAGVTSNGKNVGSTHQHANSGGSGTGGQPI